jgi:hypothetical protein
MLDYSTAESIMKQYVASQAGHDREFAVMQTLTIERPFGWVFFYNSKQFLETGDISQALVGNAPLIVDRADGSVHVTGTAEPIEHYLKEYEAQRSTPNVAAR